MPKDDLILDILMNSPFDKDAGGRETWLYNFLPELLEHNYFHNVNLFGFKTPEQPHFKDAIEALDLNSGQDKKLFTYIFEKHKGRLPIAYYMFKCLKAFSKSSKEKPNYVLAVGVFEMLMAYRIPRYNHSKKVIWLRSIFSHEKAYAIPKLLRRWLLKYEIKQLQKADLVLGNGDDIKEFYEAHGIPVTVIKNGVSMQKWRMPAPAVSTPIHVAYIGRLSQVKGIEDYFSLIERVVNGQYSDHFVFHIVGEAGAYKERVQRLALYKNVINHDSIPNDQLPEFLKGIDVCVALTYASSEGGGGGTSNAMMEQMAAGRVMLGWDNRIFRQYLHVENSYLAKQHDVEDLMQQLYLILEDPTLARKKAFTAIATIKPYSYSLNVANFLKTIDSIIA